MNVILKWAKEATVFNWISPFIVVASLVVFIIGILGIFNIGLLHTDGRIYVYSIDNPTENQAIEARTYLSKYIDIIIPNYFYYNNKYQMEDVSYTTKLNIPYYHLSDTKYDNQTSTGMCIGFPVVPCLFFFAGITYKEILVQGE